LTFLLHASAYDRPAMDALSARFALCRRHGTGAWLLAFVMLLATGAAAGDEPHAARRADMVAEVRAHAPNEARLDRDVLAVMAKVPRHAFVPASQLRHAYENRPLAIGHGQTISQPYIVALMTTLARPRRDSVVLEIGTGSGYQAAVLAEMVDRVYSIEIIEPLGKQAALRLRALGYDNVHTRIGDGYYGWPQAGPFDAIVVTAAASSVPPPLLAQLKPGGRMVIPVGSSFFTQTLMLVEKDAAGRVRTRQVLPVRFVPLTGGH
jgi:protein-L-isoaspartate(D-aspartate) O-methyltransferase